MCDGRIITTLLGGGGRGLRGVHREGRRRRGGGGGRDGGVVVEETVPVLLEDRDGLVGGEGAVVLIIHFLGFFFSRLANALILLLLTMGFHSDAPLEEFGQDVLYSEANVELLGFFLLRLEKEALTGLAKLVDRLGATVPEEEIENGTLLEFLGFESVL